jgi:hypothetical protein
MYSEQLGQYLHEGGSMGETNLRYILMGPTANFLISGNSTGFSSIGALTKPADQARKLLVQLLEGSLCGGRSRGDYEVQIIRETLRRRTKHFFQTSPHLVALHRCPHLFRDREAQSRFAYRVGQSVNGE